MKKTKIDWADSTWNPVTGCLHGCEYCYARRIAERFGGWCYSYTNNEACCEGDVTESDGKNHVLDEKPIDAYKGCVAPYPFGFDPTFHRYRLDEPTRWTKPRTIFVCSMADLFGDWIPDTWIEEIFAACERVPLHRYLFLTKNPKRYIELAKAGLLPTGRNMWYGSTITTPETKFFYHNSLHTFVSVEPILAPFLGLTDRGNDPTTGCDWIIIGAETGNRKQKVIPEKSWIMEILETAEKTRTPVFLKETLRDMIGADFRQEYPWGKI